MGLHIARVLNFRCLDAAVLANVSKMCPKCFERLPDPSQYSTRIILDKFGVYLPKSTALRRRDLAIPRAVQHGDPISAGVNQGELRRRCTSCERHNSGPGHCPTVVPPHRREPIYPWATCDPRSPRSPRGAAVANPVSLSVAGTFL